MNEIGYRIKCIRKQNNHNQSEFAKNIGISQGNLSEIEIGNSNPSAETLISIKRTYHVNLNWLLTGDGFEEGEVYANMNEKVLIEGYRLLDEFDKIELVEIIHLKNRLKSKLTF